MMVCNDVHCTHVKAQLKSLNDNTCRKIVIIVRDGTNWQGQTLLDYRGLIMAQGVYFFAHQVPKNGHCLALLCVLPLVSGSASFCLSREQADFSCALWTNSAESHGRRAATLRWGGRQWRPDNGGRRWRQKASGAKKWALPGAALRFAPRVWDCLILCCS